MTMTMQASSAEAFVLVLQPTFALLFLVHSCFEKAIKLQNSIVHDLSGTEQPDKQLSQIIQLIARVSHIQVGYR